MENAKLKTPNRDLWQRLSKQKVIEERGEGRIVIGKIESHMDIWTASVCNKRVLTSFGGRETQLSTKWFPVQATIGRIRNMT